jgi:hypothetical protein
MRTPREEELTSLSAFFGILPVFARKSSSNLQADERRREREREREGGKTSSSFSSIVSSVQCILDSGFEVD